uniref:DNA-directed RNA polymerase subunit beta n=1 Tax=Lotharella vacuolata TaxID=74820 RepID=A0A140JZW7_9EUKA|nr:RNA polymerase beta subunit [Lotharella vacuolata]BAU62644.1 RNA polymerase beta subunit [Lotharella vacuolata]
MYITPLFFPNLLRIQRNSFLNFLEYGLKKEIQKLEVILETEKNIKIIFYPKLYQLELPYYNCNDCILNSETYSCELSIPIKFVGPVPRILWINLANIPVLTNNCHFILNGSPRVVVSQMVRSPGIYFHKGKDDFFILSYYADIISERGTWLRLEMTENDYVVLRTKSFPGIPFIIFLQALGLKPKTIYSFLPREKPIDLIDLDDLEDLNKNKLKENNELKEDENFEEDEILQENKKRYDETYDSQILALRKIDKHCKYFFTNNGSITWNLQLLFNRFMSPKYYDLGYVGRIQLNKKFHFYKNNFDLTLNVNDLLLSVHFLFKFKYGLFEDDEIDNLKNKRVKIIGELLQYQLIIGIQRLKISIKNRILKLDLNNELNINKVFSSKPMNTTIAEFFGLNPLSQFMDEINPLSIITHKRRLSSLGLGGISADNTILTIRSIHPTLYGRICPIETPEGKNAGLVNSFSIFADVKSDCFLQTPLYKINNGHIVYNTGINCLAADYDDTHSILSADVKRSRVGFLSDKKLPTLIKQELRELDSKDIDFISISRIQMLSIATSLIPFLEHNDANRVLMGSNMQRQAVPLLIPECCLVGTGLESKIINDLDEGINSYSDGIVYYLSFRKLIIYNFIRKYKKILLKDNFLRFTTILNINSFDFLKQEKIDFNKIKYNSLFLFFKNKKVIQIHSFKKFLKFQKIDYFLHSYKHSNQGTCSLNRVQVNSSQWVIKRNSLANGLSMCQNELALGKNLFVGYISWKGYNFEDAVVISKKLRTNHVYTSTHLEKFEIEITSFDENVEFLTRDVPGITFEQQKKLDNTGIIKIGSFVSENDILVGKVLRIKSDFSSPYRKLLKNIFKKGSKDLKYEFKDVSFKVPKYKKGRITLIKYQPIKKKKSRDKSYNRILLIHLLQNRIIQIGDKISGRHGNKGVISQVLEEINMPYLVDGTALDIILNPLGVPSRMNIGQVLECLLGLASTYVLKRFKIIPFDEAIDFELSRNFVYSKLYLSKIKTGNKWLFNLTYPGKTKLIDAYSGLYFDQPITVGKAYILKLIHLVEEKIHARSTGPYALVTQQPLKGKSKQGGQRIGEMEVWALEGYGAAYILHELLTIKSDDSENRQHVVSVLLESRSSKVRTTETFKVLIRELQSLCLNVQFFK